MFLFLEQMGSVTNLQFIMHALFAVKGKMKLLLLTNFLVMLSHNRSVMMWKSRPPVWSSRKRAAVGSARK